MRGLITILIVLLNCAGYSQNSVDPVRVDVAVFKTTTIVFPANILSVDRGSENIITQKSADNILKVKAAVVGFKETNLTVVTADGKLYSFLVNYSESPERLTIHVGNMPTVFAENKLTGVAEKVLKERSIINGLKFASGNMVLQLQGFYTSGANLFCKIRIENRSPIGYDIEQFHFYTRDNRQQKRTASQETERVPLYVGGDTTTIQANSARIWVIALEKFTIPDDKHFAIEILEKNGGRHLLLKVYGRHIVKAKNI